jgi:hypothetical protein
MFFIDVDHFDIQIKRGVALRGPTVKWPNGTVPYEIRAGYSKHHVK